MNEELENSLKEFNSRMAHQLDKNDHKGGWRDESPYWLVTKLTEELGEVAVALENANSTTLIPPILEGQLIELYMECADVANMAFLIADAALHQCGYQMKKGDLIRLPEATDE